MTICVWDGNNLAVDSRVTAGGTVISDKFNKMFQFTHPELGPMVGVVTGACDFIGPWLQTMAENGFTPVNIPGADDDYSMTGLFIDGNGECWVVSSNGGYYHMGKQPTALGSGTSLATYLLSKGKNALFVAKEVCADNLFCGGTIKVFNSKSGKITEHKEE